MRGRKESGSEEDARGRRERGSEKDGEGERGSKKRRARREISREEGEVVRMTERKEGGGLRGRRERGSEYEGEEEGREGVRRGEQGGREVEKRKEGEK